MFETSWKAWKPTVILLFLAFISFLSTLQKPSALLWANWIVLGAIAVFVVMAIVLIPWRKNKT